MTRTRRAELTDKASERFRDAHLDRAGRTRIAGRRPVVDDAQLAVLRVMVDRRRSLGEDHTRMIAQLHELLLTSPPNGVGDQSTCRTGAG